MIAKQVPMQSIGKSDFGALVSYLTGDQEKHERVGAVKVTNCQSDEYRIAILEALNTQAKNTRATSDKTYHLIVSFRSGEQLDDATMQAIEARICESLGFGEHQRVSVVHHDTDNLHFHIAINKIHPTRYTIHDPYNDHKTLGQVCEKLEREFGLQVDNHQAHKTGSENRAQDMERHAGIESLLGWIKRECADQIKGAQSWAELRAVLQSNGLELHARGNGFVITDGKGQGVKASSVARELSKAKLEQRYGQFDPAPAVAPGVAAARVAKGNAPKVGRVGAKPPPRSQNRLHSLGDLDALQINSGNRYQGKPMPSRIDTVELYGRYRNEQQTQNVARAAELAKAIERKNRALEDVKRAGRLKRAATKMLKGAGQGKKILYAATSQTMKEGIQSVNAKYLKERKEIYERYEKLAWADWLRAKATKGDQEALAALRAREAATGLKGNTVAGTAPRAVTQTPEKQDSVTKKGTVIYRVGPTAVRDDGDKLNVSRGANQEGLEAALRMAMQRYGSQITVKGTDTFKEQIAKAAAAARLPVTFDDAALERRRQEILNSITVSTKEKPDDSRTTGPATPSAGRSEANDRAGIDRRRVGGAGSNGYTATTVNRAGSGLAGQWADGRKPVPGGGLPGKPNVGRIGARPPPEAQNRLRGLSQLRLVQLAKGGEVLLPGHVPGDVEHERAKPVDGVRRDISRPGVTKAVGQAATAPELRTDRDEVQKTVREYAERQAEGVRQASQQKTAADVVSTADHANEFDLNLARLSTSRQTKVQRVEVKAGKRQERREKAVEVLLRQKPGQAMGMLASLKQLAVNEALDAFAPTYERARKLVDQAAALRSKVSKEAAGVRSWALAKLEKTNPGLHAQVAAYRTAQRLAEFKRQEAGREKSRGKDKGVER